MTSHTGSQINQELLSAYIDGEVNSQEQRLVEMALAADPEIAWEVESLRRTVALLGDLPAIALPQSFVLPEARVADVVATRRAAQRQKTSQTASSLGDLWQSLLDFLGGGNLLLRNAAGVAAVAFFVLLAGDAFTGAPALPAPQAMSQPMPAAAPAIAQADVQPETAEMAVMAEEPVAEEMPAAKAMPAPQDLAQNAEPAAAVMSFAEESAEPAQDAPPLIPDTAAPMPQGAGPRPAGGGGGDGLGGGGGGEIAAPQPLQAAPAALAQSAPPAADIQRIAPAPAEAESANQDMVEAASLSITEMAAAPAESVAESAEAAADSAPQTATMSEPAADVAAELAAEPVAEIAAVETLAQEPASAPVPAAPAQAAPQPAPTPQLAEGPFSPLRLAQLGLALLALLLSGLWVRSR